MTITKMTTTQELGKIFEQTSFFDSGTEIHTVRIVMGGTSVSILMHKRPNGAFTKPDINIHELKGECTIVTKDTEKIKKTTRNLELDDGEKFKVVDLVVS